MIFKKLDKLVGGINFKKVTKWYIIVSLLVIIAVLAGGAYEFKDKIAFTVNYYKIENQVDHQGLDPSIEGRLGTFANSSDDIKDVFLLDKDNKIIYSAQNSDLSKEGKLTLTKINDKKDFFQDVSIPDTYFKVTGVENLLFTEDFYRDSKDFRRDYNGDFFYESNFNSKKIYFLNYFTDSANGMKVYIINDIKPVPNAERFLEISAGLLMLIFGVYWLLLALWVYKDAGRRRLNAPLWGLLLLITNLVGFIVYAIYKQNNQTCYKCGVSQNKNNTFCSCCGTKINESCEKCGAIVTKQDIYCVRCGDKIEKQEADN
ncbi:zinc ribbon domain-containing protein [Dehalobacter sp. TeCB1]|uniref:zinc ribbon domain-containing protein n=1 Tax=Dehalobacter sp. TeCB1 TaxID=1843715 RepID=UPI00083AB483|nr:zinc ribbon domain-containing protein [Dehalobacter sp. TeCB1]OCZ49830.1 hypothetical protein A7D23_00325 [Dehalobacter sp. TeCB1]